MWKARSPQDCGELSTRRHRKSGDSGSWAVSDLWLEQELSRRVLFLTVQLYVSPVPPEAATHTAQGLAALLAAARWLARSAQSLEGTLSGRAYAVGPLQPVPVGTEHPRLSQIHTHKAHGQALPTSDRKWRWSPWRTHISAQPITWTGSRNKKVKCEVRGFNNNKQAGKIRLRIICTAGKNLKRYNLA